MKLSIGIFLTLLAVATSQEDGVCFSAVSQLCNRDALKNVDELSQDSGAKCTAQYGGFKNDRHSMVPSAERLVNDHLTASMEYLLLANNYAQWDNNRAGFHKFFDKHSDNAWDDAVALIHHMVQRGKTPRLSINKPLPTPKSIENSEPKNFTSASEIENLSWALDKEQRLVKATFDLIKASHDNHDPEFVHFLSEQLSDKQVMRVKTLANHVNTLHRVMHENKDGELTPTDAVDHSFAIHLYDTQILK